MKQYYEKIAVRDLESRPEAHIAEIQLSLDSLKAKVGGFQYQPRDLVDHIQEAATDDNVVLYVNPPGFKRGYEKLYDTGDSIQFDQPTYNEFDPKTGYACIRGMLADQPAIGLRLMNREPSDDEAGEVVCVEENRGTYLLSNRPQEVIEATGGRVVFTKKQHNVQPLPDVPVYDDEHEFTTESTIGFRAIDKTNAMYYRDLFVHRLGAAGSEKHYALIVDGYLTSVVGIHLFNANRGVEVLDGHVYVEETYGFSAQSYRYPRLNRLLMMCITCQQFREVLPEIPHETWGLATTCLCEHPDHKPNRGILKVHSREHQKNGLWKLRFRAKWREQTFQETLQTWLTKHGRSDFVR